MQQNIFPPSSLCLEGGGVNCDQFFLYNVIAIAIHSYKAIDKNPEFWDLRFVKCMILLGIRICVFEFSKDDWLEYKSSLQLCRHQQNNTESSWNFFTAHNLNRRKDKQHQEVMAGRGPSGGGVGGAQEDWRSALFPRLAGLRQQECFTDTRCQKSPFKNRTVGLYFHSANDINAGSDTL